MDTQRKGIDMEDYETKMRDEDEFQRKQQRFEAALAFTVAACDRDRDGMISDDDITYAIRQADRMIDQMDKSPR